MCGSFRSLGWCLVFACALGRATQAQESWEELIRRSEKLLDEAKLGDAETVLLSAVRAAEVFGPTDGRLAETQHRLALVYSDLGRLPEAEKWYQRSLSAWKASVGKPDSRFPKPLISLASFYLENGLGGKAERLVDPWLRDADFKLEASDPLSLGLLHNFAGLKHAQRRYSEAEMLYRQVLSAAGTGFGPGLQVSVLNNLGLLLAQTGRSGEALSYLQRALAIQEGVQPPDDITLAQSLSNLASCYRSTREYAKAEPLLQRALTIAQNSLGPDNRLIGTILAEYGTLLRKTKRKSQAKVLESRALAIRQGHSAADLGRHTIDYRDLIAAKD